MSYKVTKGRIAKLEHPVAPQVRDNDGKRGFQTFEDLEVYKAEGEFRTAMYASIAVCRTLKNTNWAVRFDAPQCR